MTLMAAPLYAEGVGAAPESEASRTSRAAMRYARLCARCHAAFPRLFARGVTRAELVRAERKVRRRLPDGVRDLLSFADGSGERQVLPGWALLSARGIVRECCLLKRGSRSGDARGDLLPIGSDGVGNYLCIVTGAVADAGNVVVFWRDEPCLEFVAGSLAEYLESLTIAVQRDEIAWDEDWGGIYRRPPGAGGEHAKR